jgi:hypothetical protein
MWIGRILLWAAMLAALVAAFKYWQVEKSAGFEVRGAGVEGFEFEASAPLVFADWWLDFCDDGLSLVAHHDRAV